MSNTEQIHPSLRKVEYWNPMDTETTPLSPLPSSELRVKVAEKLGWKVWSDGPPDHDLLGLHPARHQPDDNPVAILHYDTDLNACAEMEKAIPEGNSLNGRVAYTNALMRICGSHSECVFATARQRCLAFLKVMG
jgi:hypothetical protein